MNKVLDSGEIPEDYNNLEEVAIDLGCFYGFAYGMGYDWEFMVVGEDEEDRLFCMMSEDQNWLLPFVHYMINIICRGGENTCLLLYNMVADLIKTTPENKHNIIM